MGGQTSVDPQRRARYAELLRHFAAGRLTNDEYEDAAAPLFRGNGDAALREIFATVWTAYDDLHEHRLAGRHALNAEGRRAFARMVVFLHTELPYEWPTRPIPGCVIGIVTLGRWPREPHPLQREGSVWPFFRASDLHAALSQPRLLGGAARARGHPR